MQRRVLIKKLKERGFEFLRAGSKHDIWFKGASQVSIPRHNKVNELTALRIIKDLK